MAHVLILGNIHAAGLAVLAVITRPRGARRRGAWPALGGGQPALSYREHL